MASALRYLSDQWKLAILLHEIGHLLAGYEGTEAQANKAIESASKIKIHYKDGKFGKRVEWISKDDLPRARKLLFGKAEG